MNNGEKFSYIVKLAREASQKSLAELTREEQHAVIFLGNKYPASNEDGVLKYDNKSTKFAWICSYISSRALNKMFARKETFSPKTFQVYHSEGIEPFDRAPALECLDEYPDKLLIPKDRDYTIDLPPLESIKLEFPYIRQTVAAGIARVQTALLLGESMPLEFEAIHLIAYRNPEDFKVLTEKAKVNGFALLNFSPRLTQAPAGHLSLEASGSESSYLTTYIYLATKKTFLKPKPREE